MKILLVAYEFPPSASPQSLRWTYLVRELVRAGHEVHVLAPDASLAAPDLLPLVSGAVVHRTFPGPLARLLQRGGGQAERQVRCGTTSSAGEPAARSRAPRLNWKGQVAESIKAVARWLVFPDVRGEWNPWARRKLARLLGDLSPDVVISSHEPASTVALGRLAHGRGFPWVVDLGDPVLSSYTAAHWRRRALRTERVAVLEADAVLVTSERTRELMVDRHAVEPGRCHVITQGYDDSSGDIPSGQFPDLFDERRLELLYTGRLYAFRRIDWLLDKLPGVPDVRLTVVTNQAPATLLDAAAKLPEQVRVFGPLPHRTVLELQRRCDVLLNIANDDPVQVPGKFYEYLGARKPILHMGKGGDDAVAGLLRASGHACSVVSTRGQLEQELTALAARKRTGKPLAPVSALPEREAYSWRSLAARVAAICADAAGRQATPVHHDGGA